MKSFRYTNNIFVALYCTLFLISCESEKNNKQNEIKEVRKVVYDYSNITGDEKMKANYDKIKNNENPNIRFINEISYAFFCKCKHLDEKIAKLDSVIYNVNFEELPAINKFYTYYFLSYTYHLTLEPDKAFNYNKKANSYIENEINNYYPEKQKLQYLIMLISAKVFNDENELIENHKANLKLLINSPNVHEKVKNAYNIGYRSMQTGQYTQAIYYAKMAQKSIPKISDNHLFIDALATETDGYAKLGKLDSVRYVSQKVQKLYDNKSISKEDLFKYKVFFAGAIYDIYPKDSVNKLFTEILNFYKNDCDNRYFLTETYKAMSKFFNKYNDVNAEKEYLLKGLYYTQNCGMTNDFYLSEEERILDRLLMINLNQKNTDFVEGWYKRKKELGNLRNDQTNLFVKLTQYFSEREVNYVNKDLEYQKSKVSNSKRVNFLYSILVLVFIFASVYIAFLFFKNVKYQQKLSKGSEKLKEQNNTITIQNKKMQKLVKALRESNENLQNFARIAAHDIKSPISSIHSAINYISEKYQPNIDTEDKEIFQYLNQSTSNLSNMINVLLEYSSSNKNIVKNQEVNIVEVISRVLKNLKTEIEKNGSIIEYSKSIPKVEANESLIEQVFLNIISNALKFKKEDKILKISIDYEITFDQKILFIVSDNGIGIDPIYSKEIFKVFKKVHQYNEIEGSGIGLAICKKIIEEFNGTIWVESEKNVGSHFFFTLPLYPVKTNKESLSTDKINP